MLYLRLSFEIVFPIVLLMAAGYFIRLLNPATRQGFDMINSLVFRVFFPLRLFFDIIDSDFKTAFQIKLLIFSLLGITLCFVVFGLIVPRIISKASDASVVAQGLSRANFVIFGLPIAANMYPGGDLGVMSVIAAFVVPFLTIASVVLFEFFRGDRPDFKLLAISVVTNRYVLAAVFGCISLNANITLPAIIAQPLRDMGMLSTTLALMCLGSSFSFGELGKYSKILAVSCVIRLIALPAVFIGVGLLMGYRNIELTVILLLFGSPAAAAAYSTAKELGGNEVLAGMITAVTTVASILSMFFWIFALKYFQFL